MLLASTAYIVPVMIATGAANIDQDNWRAGAFAIAGTEIGGRWLGNWIVVSSAVSVIASFCSELAAGRDYILNQICIRFMSAYNHFSICFNRLNAVDGDE